MQFFVASQACELMEKNSINRTEMLWHSEICELQRMNRCGDMTQDKRNASRAIFLPRNHKDNVFNGSYAALKLRIDKQLKKQ